MIVAILKNKWTWIIIGSIVLLVIISRNWYKIERLWQPTDVDLEAGEQGITKERQSELESYAQNIYDSIYGDHDDAVYDTLMNVTDNELKYVSKYYRRHITQGNWLYKDVDDEYFSYFNDRDVRLMSRLAKVGEKG